MSESLNELPSPDTQEQQPTMRTGPAVRFDAFATIARFMNELPGSGERGQQSAPCTSCRTSPSPCSANCNQTVAATPSVESVTPSDDSAQVSDAALIQGVLLPVTASLHSHYRSRLLTVTGSSLRLALRCLGQWTKLKWRSLFGDYRI